MSRRALLTVTVTVLLAAAVTLPFLDQPPGLIFDEVYYVEDARSILTTGVEEGFAVHPPVGKWLIAGGIAVLGDNEVGWRLPGALAAILAVGVLAMLVRWLTGRTWAGLLAGGLLAVDGVWLVQARTAMLDAPLAALTVLGVALVTYDHRRSRPSVGALVVRRWPLFAGGGVFGLAVATKWSGVLPLAGAALLAAGWEVAAARRRGATARDAALRLGPVVLALAVVPAAVYALTWVPWLANYEDTDLGRQACEEAAAAADCTFGPGERLAGLVDHHRRVLTFHLGLEADHPYRAPATTWPTQARPVVFAYDACREDGTPSGDDPSCVVPPGKAREVLAVGNPALWWMGLLLIPVAASALRRREGTVVVPLTLLAAQFVPWFGVARPVFSFYAVPLVPFLVAAVVLALHELGRPARRAYALGGAAVAAVLAGGIALLTGSDLPATVTEALLAATGGAVIGGSLDAHRERDRGPGRRPGPTGTTVAIVLATLAFAAFVHLAPVHYGVVVDQEVIRARWWFPGWI